MSAAKNLFSKVVFRELTRLQNYQQPTKVLLDCGAKYYHYHCPDMLAIKGTDES
jgi:hypothetical protein